MIGRARSCLGRGLALVVLLAAAYAGWRWGPAVFPTVERWLGLDDVAGYESPAASPELAEATLDRLERFRAGDGPAVLSLGDAELSSVVRYALPGLVPPGVDRPAVRLVDGRVLLLARVAVGAFPDLPALDQVLGILPDSVDILMEGTLGSWGRENLALTVHRVEASRIPLPSRMIPDVLNALGRREREGLAPESMLIPLPEGLASAYVQRDSLVLVADR